MFIYAVGSVAGNANDVARFGLVLNVFEKKNKKINGQWSLFVAHETTHTRARSLSLLLFFFFICLFFFSMSTWSNSTEPRSDFVMKKWVGFTCGMLSAIAAACSAYALRRIVYPRNGAATSSIFIIVLKLFMATSIADVIYSLNNTLTFSDWNPLSLACQVRGIWFQIGFQSSFFFTACTAYELYNMISTTMKDSSFAIRNHRESAGVGGSSLTQFQFYFAVNLFLVVVAVLVIWSNDGFGASSRTYQHTLCWVYTTQWTALVAMVPAFLCWLFNCVFIGLSAYRLWKL